MAIRSRVKKRMIFVVAATLVGKGNYVTYVPHSCQIHDTSLKSKSETCVTGGPVAAQIQIHAELKNSMFPESALIHRSAPKACSYGSPGVWARRGHAELKNSMFPESALIHEVITVRNYLPFWERELRHGCSPFLSDT